MIYDPIREELFAAQSGEGATLNGARIAAGGASALSECVIGFDLGNSPELYGNAQRMLAGIVPGPRSTRVIGCMSLGLAYAAAGRTDVYFNLGASEWDVAAGVLVAREAGMEVTDLAGEAVAVPTKGLVAAPPGVHREFLALAGG